MKIDLKQGSIMLMTGLCVALLVIFCSSCATVKRVEKDIYEGIHASEDVSFKIEACWTDKCVYGVGDTLAGAVEDMRKSFEDLAKDLIE